MSHSHWNDYFSDFIEDSPIRSKTFQSENIEKIQEKYSINGMGKETIFEMKLRNNLKDLRQNTYFISIEDISKYKDSFQAFGILIDNNAKNIGIRNFPKINDDQYEAFKNSIINKEELDNLYEFLNRKKYNFKNHECGISVGGLASLKDFVESNFIENQYDILKTYINQYRAILGDGNCFYRSVMFRYLEILVLNNQIDILQNITYDV